MDSETLIWLALAIPTLGAGGIALAGRAPDLREGVTLATAGLLFLTVVTLTARVLDGARPVAEGFEVLPGLALAFAVEPLWMLFPLIAARLRTLN